jgi:hypothetical protein
MAGGYPACSYDAVAVKRQNPLQEGILWRRNPGVFWSGGIDRCGGKHEACQRVVERVKRGLSKEIMHVSTGCPGAAYRRHSLRVQRHLETLPSRNSRELDRAHVKHSLLGPDMSLRHDSDCQSYIALLSSIFLTFMYLHPLLSR